jgi:hypothetical protein
VNLVRYLFALVNGEQAEAVARLRWTAGTTYTCSILIVG